MAFYDDPEFIISHIRNSYITSDDTGMCEVVIVDEGLPVKTHKVRCHESSGDSSEDSNDQDMAHSFDIVSDMDLGAHRRRSNTAQRLDRLKKERQSQALIKHIQWKENIESPSVEILEQFFKKKDLTVKPPQRFTSLLSEQLNQQPSFPNNPFSEFAKFDGMASIGIPTKKIKIFLTMLPQGQRAYPLPVVVIATAKVRELVGLICWQYTNERREPKLKDNIEYYSLHIAEDDGEVDLDFPSLDSKEVISKFGFSVLALVERGSPSVSNNKVNLIIRFPGEQPTSFSAENLNMTIREVLEKAITKQWGSSQNTFADEYWLERQSNPGVKLNNGSTLASLNCTDFRLVKSSRGGVNGDKEEWPLSGMAVMEAPLYQSYVVSLLSRVRPKTGIHLGISGEKIEIDPVQHKGSAKLWSRSQKPVSYDMDSIASCEITEVKSAGRSVFRLIYVTQGHDYKHHDFECDSAVCNEIVQKTNNILEMHSSVVRREYMALKDRKAQQRRSFNLGNK